MLASSVIERAGNVITAKELNLYEEQDRVNDKILKGDPARAFPRITNISLIS